MKKLMMMAFALCLLLGMTSFAQEPSGGKADSGKAAPAPLKSLKGTVKADGDKITFVTDGDKKTWDVMNPEELKAHAGHHVEVSAHVYADKNTIHVMSVKMIKSAAKKPGAKPSGDKTGGMDDMGGMQM